MRSLKLHRLGCAAFFVLVLAVGSGAKAATLTSHLDSFTGPVPSGSGFPVLVPITTFAFTVPLGDRIVEATLAGHFGIPSLPTSAPAVIFGDGIEVAECIEGFACSVFNPNDPGPTFWEYSFTSLELPLLADGFLELEAFQNNFTRVQLSDVTLTVRTIPEPSTLILLGIGVVAFALHRHRRTAALLAASISIGCGLPELPVITAPLEDELALVGPVAFAANQPGIGVDVDVTVTLDGADITNSLDIAAGTISGFLDATAGSHEVVVTITENGNTSVASQVSFEAIDLLFPDRCEILNNVTCLYPYPSSRFLVPDETETGFRVDFPQEGMIVANGPPVLPDPYNEVDGFSPTVQILMHFPDGVDVEGSDAPRLLAPGCCGQPPGPPFERTRTTDGRSLEADSPTVLIHADTGERVLHWVENDARAEGNPERQSFIMRPGKSLVPGERYIVAIRELVQEDESPVSAEAPFAALRDDRPSSIPALEDRRDYFESEIFPQLDQAGVDRESLILAFDFTTQSDHQLTHQMLSMRDQAFAWLQDREDAGDVTFTVTDVGAPNDCSDPTQLVSHVVEGTYQSPNFLEGNYLNDPLGVQFHTVDENDTPVMNGTVDALFTISIPCSAVRPDPPVIHPLVLGHGLLGTGRGFVRDIDDLIQVVTFSFGGVGEFDYITGGTDWSGLSSPDLAWLGASILGILQNQLNNFPALPDRLRQGQLNTLVLARMMKRGHFNSHPAFQTEGGQGIFPGPEVEAFYFGASLGGIMGLMFSALTPDMERLSVDVPSINFSGLLQRATPFQAFQDVIETIGVTDPIDTLLLIGVGHELWVSGESAAYARHITSDPLPGTNAKKILMTVAFLDKQVSNQITETAARTLELPQLEGSYVAGMEEIPDLPGPLDSAVVFYSTGAFDLFEPAHEPFIPPLANLIPNSKCDPHGERGTIPASLLQLNSFLRPGGVIENFCNDVCDGATPWEKPRGVLESCDPTS